MAYHVRLTDRATRDLEDIYLTIHADSSPRAFAWFNRLEKAIYSLERFPDRGAETPEHKSLRHLPFGKRSHIYRIIYSVDHISQVVTVLHIRHRARKAFRESEIQ